MSDNLTNLRKVQLEQLKMLDECVKIFKKYNMDYYLIGGTLIGTQRNKGFIPWDDDIDIAVKRSDYDKFIEIANKELKNPYRLIHYSNDDDYTYYLANIINKNIFVTIMKETPIKTNVSIDILPIDGIPNNKIARLWHKFVVYYYRCLAGFVNIDTIRKKKRSFVEKVLIAFGKVTKIGKRINLKKVRIKNDKFVRKYKYEDCEYVGTFYGNYGFHEVVPKHFYGKGSLVEFEGKKYIGPEKVDEFLTHFYGDYMSLPPKDKRVGHHIIKIDNIK